MLADLLPRILEAVSSILTKGSAAAHSLDFVHRCMCGMENAWPRVTSIFILVGIPESASKESSLHFLNNFTSCFNHYEVLQIDTSNVISGLLSGI